MFNSREDELEFKIQSDNARFTGAATGKFMGELLKVFEVDKIKDADRKRQAEKSVVGIFHRLNPFLVELLEVVESQREEIYILKEEIDKFLFTNAIMIEKLKTNGMYDGEGSKVPTREQVRGLRSQRA